MKPTQEQLNDPKWWDKNAPEDCDLFYEDERLNYWFAQSESSHSCHSLLAERPTKPAFVPDTNTKTIYWVAEVDTHGTPWNFDGPHEDRKSAEDSIPLLLAVGEKNRKLVVTSMEFSPIKSERELFLDSVKKELPTADKDDLIFAGALYDSGLFCLKEADK